MDKITKIREWLDGDQNYFQGIELYNNHAYGGRRIFPMQPTCPQCLNQLKAELENILQIAESEASSDLTSDYQEGGAESTVNEELLAANLDEMPWAEMKSLFARLELEAPSAKKVDILAALKAAQLKLQTPQ
jgi:hypothetical protein